LVKDDESRVNFLKACLAKLGLVISQETSSVPSLSRLHLSSQHHFLVPELLASWENIISKEDGEEYIRGENDTFHLEKQVSRWSLGSLVKSLPLPGVSGESQEHEADQTADAGSDDRIVDYSTITKRIIPHEAEWPGTKETPYFNHHSFYANLQRYQRESDGEAEEFGKTLLYGEVVTSTNTLLEK
jgi:biotin---protein ligase